jgi:hypothetical protein
MSGYFSFFPSLMYANTASTNLIAKVKFDEAVLKRSATFYPYTIVNNERADRIADSYYGDPSYDWLIYLSNNIVDPLNEWPKPENEFNDFLTLKYGSISNTQIHTAFYHVNYETDESVISTAVYGALSAGQKKYWVSIVNTSGQVISYQRKPLDAVVETNQIVMLTGSFTGLSASDVIKQSSSVRGTIGFANSTNVMLKHVTGTWATSTPTYYVLSGASANATITATSIVNQSIPVDEITYWAAISVYQNEATINENRKHLRLLSSSFIDVVERDMKDLLG